MRAKHKAESKFHKYMRRTWKNKALAITALMLGYVGAFTIGNYTGLALIALFAVPLFFSSRTNVY